MKYIPKDVFDKRAVEKGQARFFDVAYLNAKIKTKGKTITVELTDFVTHYTQDDIEEIQQSMRAGSKVVIEDGQIIKIDKDKNGIINRTFLTENWYDWIDYWAIDFNYEHKKEIIKVKNDKGKQKKNGQAIIYLKTNGKVSVPKRIQHLNLQAFPTNTKNQENIK